MNDQRLMMWANGDAKLYLGMLFVLSIATWHLSGALLSAATVGFSYCCTTAQAYEPKGRGAWFAFALYVFTFGLGATAGIVVLVLVARDIVR